MILLRNLLFLLSVLFVFGLSTKPMSAQITNTEGEQLKKQLQQRVNNPKPYNPETAQRIRNSKIEQQRAIEAKRQQAGNAGAPSRERLNPETRSNTGFRGSVLDQQRNYRPGSTPTLPPPVPARRRAAALQMNAPLVTSQRAVQAQSAQSSAPVTSQRAVQARSGQSAQSRVAAPVPARRPAAPISPVAPPVPQTPKPSYSAGFPGANNPRPSAQPRPVSPGYNGQANPYGQRAATPVSSGVAQRPRLNGGDPKITAPRPLYVKPAILNTTLQQRNALTKDMSPSAKEAFNKKYRDARASHQRHKRSAQRPVAQRPATPAQPANLKKGHGKLPPAPGPNQVPGAKRPNPAPKAGKKPIMKGRRGPR